jgi:hypothetical protein
MLIAKEQDISLPGPLWAPWVITAALAFVIVVILVFLIVWRKNR